MTQSRRSFLQHGAAALSALMLDGRLARRWPRDTRPQDLLADPDETLAIALAHAAVDAARRAGAGFADVRVTLATGFQLEGRLARGGAFDMPQPQLRELAGYGVRVIVDGAWGFAGGYALTEDAVAETARQAVAIARGNRPRHPRTIELAPAPRVADGRWQTLMARDPFAVPFEEQVVLLQQAMAAAATVPGFASAGCWFRWDRQLHVFASTGDSLIVQRLLQAGPGGGVSAEAANAALGGTARGYAEVEALRKGGWGYEAVAPEALVAAFADAGRRAVAEARARTRPKPVLVGRYDLVFSPAAMAALLNTTVVNALDLELALGYRRNRQGSSWAAPPAEILGRYQVAAPLLSLEAERDEPHGAATVGWDDEGVKPARQVIVEDGIVTGYHSSRETATALKAWQGSHGGPEGSSGCVWGRGGELPGVGLPNIAMRPARQAVSGDDLVRDTRRGIYVDMLNGDTDQQLLSAQFRVPGAREIMAGRLGAPLSDAAIQFATPVFWKNLDAIGGAGSARQCIGGGGGSGIGNDFASLGAPASTFTVVPARVRGVNVMNTGRTG